MVTCIHCLHSIRGLCTCERSVSSGWMSINLFKCYHEMGFLNVGYVNARIQWSSHGKKLFHFLVSMSPFRPMRTQENSNADALVDLLVYSIAWFCDGTKEGIRCWYKCDSIPLKYVTFFNKFEHRTELWVNGSWIFSDNPASWKFGDLQF